MRLPQRQETQKEADEGKPKVVRIIGSGHSGSTVLDIVLGNHPNIAGVGELHKLPRSGWVRNDDRRCACGSPIHECPYWTAIYQHWVQRVGEDGLARYIHLQDAYEGSRAMWPRVLKEVRRPSSRFTTYSEMTAALFEAIRDVTGRSVIVDSSKKAIRTYALLANPRLDVRVIHLVRDGRGVVWSGMKSLSRDVEAGVPKDRQPTPPSRTTFHWVLANLESEWVAKRIGGTKALRISYESFVERPGQVLSDLSLLVEEDLSPLADEIADGQPMLPGHNVGGNRLRLSGSVSLKPDFEWAAKLPPADSRTFWRLAGWLARRYGYTR